MTIAKPSPADVLGLPFLPPAPLGTLATRTRVAVYRLANRLTPPPVAILETMLGMLDHRVLVALCEADVPDLLDCATRPAELAERAGVDADRLERLLRAASVHGWVRIDRRGRVHPTRFTRFLRRDHPGGWRAFVDYTGGDEITAAVTRLTATAEPADPFLAANGAPYFEWMAEHPQRWATFDAAMAAGARVHALALLAALDWPDGSAICDVGGGTGNLLATVVHERPTTRGTVFDLPGVVARAVSHERLSAVGGDMFDEVPAGFDTYLLVNAIHDWGDNDVVTIFRSVGVAAGAARIVVVESDKPTRPRDRIATGSDVMMAAMTGAGRERDAGELGTLAEAAGLHLVRSTRLSSGDWAHELRAR